MNGKEQLNICKHGNYWNGKEGNCFRCLMLAEKDKKTKDYQKSIAFRIGRAGTLIQNIRFLLKTLKNIKD